MKPIVAAALLSLALLACGGDGDKPVATTARPAVTPSPEPVLPYVDYAKPYDFSKDWFSGNIDVWKAVLGPLKGKPDLRYLEVGVYEGRSFFWMLENILTHPSSRLTGIDIALPDRLVSNIKLSGQTDRITMIVGPSQTELKKLPVESFDLIYIDGSHMADDVLVDSVLAWQLLKVGGVIIFDDYLWDGANYTNRRTSMAPALLPRLAIDGFRASFTYEIQVLHNDFQLILKKWPNPCRTAKMKNSCSPFGQYVYDWPKGHLLSTKEPRQTVTLSDQEREVVEAILKANGVHDKMRAREEFIALKKRIDLKL
jgi:predicted O-methyltransferase YrrM